MERIFRKKIINLFTLGLLIVSSAFILSGCGSDNSAKQEFYPAYVAAKTQNAQPKTQNVPAKAQNVPNRTGNIDVDEKGSSGKMVSYDVVSIGRSDPFMPYNEMVEYEKARNAALAEAAAKNAKIKKLKNLQDFAIREDDDISPYSFNLPVPPTSLATGSVAAKITRTKVVGIMYNTEAPSAIINVDNKDYLVRPGDKIIGQEYKVVKITPTWVTAAMGSNVYSAAIGELFTNDRMNTNQTDIYKLEERFGGRKI